MEVAKVAMLVETIQGAEFRCASCGCRIGERFLDGSSFPGTPAARTGKRYSANGAARARAISLSRSLSLSRVCVCVFNRGREGVERIFFPDELVNEP